MKSFKQKSEGVYKQQISASKKTPKSSETSLKIQNTTNSKESIPLKAADRESKAQSKSKAPQKR